MQPTKVNFQIGYIWQKDKFTIKLTDNLTGIFLSVLMSADDFIEFGNDMVRYGTDYKRNPEKFMKDNMV